MSIDQDARKARVAWLANLQASKENRNMALKAIAEQLRESSKQIIMKNELDLLKAEQKNYSAAMIDRLRLTPERIESLASTADAIANQTEVIGEKSLHLQRPDGLSIFKERIPIGVVCMIFESRPNVVIDCSCLAIKSGNAILLKGGKEAENSNQILVDIIKSAAGKYINADAICLIEDRSQVAELLTRKDLIDLVIPRGGESLINYVYENAKMPVIAHFKGNCHIYIHEDADLVSAKKIVFNSKLQRPGVCNAVESLLLSDKLPQEFVEELFNELVQGECELRVCENLHSQYKNITRLATEEDWSTEYLEKILACKQVSSVKEAISHIQKYGSRHTEAILCKDKDVLELFLRQIDASCLIHNASTRFNDGGELGLGAELGISTTKLHAYGPMGAKEMCIERFLVMGDGQTRV